MSEATKVGWQSPQLHQEHFVPQEMDTSEDKAFTIELLGRKESIVVPAQQTVTEALLAHGIEIEVSCEQGVCGNLLDQSGVWHA